MLAARSRDGGDVGEVDRHADIRLGEPGCARVAVDGHDPVSELPHARDRAALVPAGADEENGARRDAHGPILRGRGVDTRGSSGSSPSR